MAAAQRAWRLSSGSRQRQLLLRHGREALSEVMERVLRELLAPTGCAMPISEALPRAGFRDNVIGGNRCGQLPLHSHSQVPLPDLGAPALAHSDSHSTAAPHAKSAKGLAGPALALLHPRQISMWCRRSAHALGEHE